MFEYRITHPGLSLSVSDMNVLGADGWELVAMERHPIRGLTCIWKREKQHPYA